MIKKIEKIKNCGIFHNFKWNSALPEFNKYNLIFGFNGSGKTTLSQAIASLARNITSEVPDYDFEVSLDDGVKINNKNINSLPNSIYIFNKDFIEKNLKSFDKFDEIIYLSPENIEKKEALVDLKKELEVLKASRKKSQAVYDEKKNTVEKLPPAIAKEMKTEFQIIGGTCATTFGNYSKTNVESLLNNSSRSFYESVNPDNENKIKSLTEELKEPAKQKLENPNIIIDYKKYNSTLSEISTILKQEVSKKVVEQYSGEILNWIEKGLHIHNGKDICFFCGNKITSERSSFLQGLFNEEYKKLISQIDILEQTLTTFDIELLSSNFDFYVDIKKEADAAIKETNLLILQIKNEIKTMQSLLKDKKQNIDKKDFVLSPVDNLAKSIYEKLIIVDGCIDRHNKQTESFDNLQKKKIKEIEKELLYKQAKSKNFFFLLDEFNKAAITDKDNEILVGQKQAEISKIENELQDVLIASNNFNNLLHQFIGRDEISLQYNETVKGYNLIRHNTNTKAERLSEGEKTAIAFVYFLTKLGENDNSIENLIIVLDDPISSLDTQNLFNAYSFIISKLNNCHQLFIFTHSFAFFKLLRERYKQKKDPTKNKVDLFFIENLYTKKDDKTFRKAQITELPKSLKLLDSEYAFCFNYIKNIIKKTEMLELDEFFTLLNYCRKVLETFSSFKIIGDNIDFKAKLEKLYLFSQNSGTELTEENVISCENVYKFVNTFSHAINFDNSSEIESLIADAKITAGKVIDLIKKVDEVHYNSLDNFDS